MVLFLNNAFGTSARIVDYHFSAAKTSRSKRASSAKDSANDRTLPGPSARDKHHKRKQQGNTSSEFGVAASIPNIPRNCPKAPGTRDGPRMLSRSLSVSRASKTRSKDVRGLSRDEVETTLHNANYDKTLRRNAKSANVPP